MEEGHPDSDPNFDSDDLDQIEGALIELAHRRGRITAGAAVTELRARGELEALDAMGFGEEMLSDIIDELLGELPQVWPLARGAGDSDDSDPMVYVSIAAVLDERVLSTRVTAAAAATRIVDADSIGVIDFDIEPGNELAIAGGGEFEFDIHSIEHEGDTLRIGGLALPDHVGPLAEGQLLSFVRRDHTVVIDEIQPDELTDDSAEIEALGRALGAATGVGVGVDLAPLLIEVLAANGDLFRDPVRPVEELLADAGFERRDSWWGPVDTPWMTPLEQRDQATRSAVAETYGLADRGRGLLDLASDVYRAWSLADRSAPEDRDAAERSTSAVADGSFADAVGTDIVGQAFLDLHRSDIEAADDHANPFETQPPGHVSDRFRRFVAAVETASPGSVGASVLASFVAELSGDARETRRLLDGVLRDQPNHGTALYRSMILAIDQSRFDDAVRFSARLYGGADANSGPLRRYADAMITAARNESCPCGSGRKYKQCHQGQPLLGEPEATQALVFKVERFTDDAAYVDQFSRWSGPEQDLVALVDDPATRDLVIHEGGFLERYLDERLDVLPPTDVERLRGWIDTERLLYEVVEVDPGLRLGVRDVDTGERLDLLEHAGSLDAKIGEYRWMRVEHHNGVHASIGVVFRVPPTEVDTVLDMIDDPYLELDDIVFWLRATSASLETQGRNP